MTVITGPMNDSLRRPCQELAQPPAANLVGQAAPGGRCLPTGGLAPCSESGRALEPAKGGTSEVVHVRQRGKSIRLACRCGHFVLNFRNLSVVRHGRFRCPICNREAQLIRLKALLEVYRKLGGEEALAPMSETGLFDVG